MNSLVSILIPTYNREKLVRECIASALAQTYKNIEIVVCDNASTDATWAVIQDMALQDPRIVAIRNETNVGPVRNWLRCLEMARGDYTKLLFSDDLIAADYLERVVPLLASPDVAFAYTAAYIGPEFGEGSIAYCNGEGGCYPTKRYFSLLKHGNVPVSPGAAIFRTADVRKHLRDSLPTRLPREFWKHGAGPDVMLYALTAREYPCVATLELPLVLFRAHGESISVSNTNNQVTDGYQAALSWFYLTYFGRADWGDYLARQWISYLHVNRSWLSMGAFASRYEGNGTVSESLQLLMRGVAVVIEKLRGRIVSVVAARTNASRQIKRPAASTEAQ